MSYEHLSDCEGRVEMPKTAALISNAIKQTGDARAVIESCVKTNGTRKQEPSVAIPNVP